MRKAKTTEAPPRVAWEWDWLPLEKAVRLQRNSKLHDLGALHTSMKRGFLDTPTVNARTGRLIGGHGRIDVLQQKKATGEPPPQGIRSENGSWLVPVWTVDVPEEEEEAVAIGLNRTTELGGWDETMLAEVLSDLAAQGNLEGTGYDEEDLDRLIGDLIPPNFSPVGVEEQGRLDQKSPVTCPECGHEFVPQS